MPVSKLHPYYAKVQSYEDLQEILRDQIAHFFAHYKDLEKGKWVRILGWDGPQKAAEMIVAGIERATADKKIAAE